MHAHDALRYEMGLLKEALESAKKRSSSSKKFEVDCLKSAWECHAKHIHSHHSNEDELFVPFLRERIVYPEKPVTDHIGIDEKHKKISNMVMEFKEGSSFEDLYTEIVEYENLVLPHLKFEEDLCLPLMRAYFTPEEIGPMVQKIVAAGPKEEMGSFICCMGEETFRKEFMVQEGIPDFVWEADFEKRKAAFVENFSTPVETLKGEGEVKSVCCLPR